MLFQSLEQFELTRVTEALETRTHLVTHTLAPLLPPHGTPLAPSYPDLQAITRNLAALAHARLTIIAPDGTVIADSDTPDDKIAGLDNHRARPEVMQALSGEKGTDIRLSSTVKQRLYYLAIPVRHDGHLTGLIRLALPLTVLDERVHALVQALTVALGVAFIVSVGLSILLARTVTRPLTEMVATAHQLADGRLDMRLPVSSHDEIGILASTLNHMAEELENKIQALSEDRAQLLAILTCMVEGVLLLDARGRILQVNPALQQMLMSTEKPIRDQPFGNLVQDPALHQLVSQVLETKQHHGSEITLAGSGRILRVEASFTGRDQPQDACAVLVFHDVTALRKLEKVRKDFVANVSHELRTPLTSIHGYVEALLDGAKDDPDQATLFLQIIMNQSDRLNLILQDLLQLSHIESGQVLFKREPVRLQSLIERTLAPMAPLAKKKQHRLEVLIPGDLLPVLGDEDRLVQVVTNLIDNAIKYTPPQGTIQIKARQVLEPDKARKSWMELSISDTGLGIPDLDRPRVFERFYRVDKARSRELGGTGLGLAIVKHIVEAHEGQVWVEANVPTGSRFIVRLPVALPQPFSQE
jgi:two-component system phosphate regulon sensor histidine kinase PhoR